MKHVIRRLRGRSLALACLLLLLSVTTARADTIYLPQVSTGPKTAPDEAARRISLPDGFAINTFALSLPGTPRFMAFGPDGNLYVSLMGTGQIARLPDGDHDGHADRVEIAASNLNHPHGIEWREGWLYVAEEDRVERLRDGDGNGSLETRVSVTTSLPAPGGHGSRTLHFGPDGKLYVSVGSTCNVCVESDPRRAAILRFNPDGTIPADNPFASDANPARRPVWAWGLRNSVDFLWTPSGQMWADHMGRDNMLDQNGVPDNLPPEEIVIPVQGGKSHGWPYCYTPVLGANPTLQPEVVDPQSGLSLPGGFTCAQAVPALFTDLAHSAPLGMTLGAGSAFPKAYQSSLYVAYHGSWNTASAAGARDCKVQRIVIENGVPTRAETFATGWREAGQSCASAWGRPADVIFGPDGAMYISDDAGERIYRVVYTGQ